MPKQLTKVQEYTKQLEQLKKFPTDIDRRAKALNDEFGMVQQPEIIAESKKFAYKQALAIMRQLEEARENEKKAVMKNLVKEKKNAKDSKVH